MPRRDPITGVDVMTVGEFWQSEAKREGKPVHELVEEFNNDLQGMVDEETKRYYDPHEVESVLAETRDDDQEPYEFPYPVKVTEVLDVRFSMTFKSEHIKLVFKAYCEDESLRTFQFSYVTFAGDFYEPPSQDIELQEVPNVEHGTG